MNENTSRRELKARSVKFFHHLAFFLVKLGLTPNQVSVLSFLFALGGGFSLLFAQFTPIVSLKLVGIVGALLGVQLRLICNLVDGLMAVEGGKKTPYGELFNDFPDRLSDIALILAAGYAVSSHGMKETPVLIAWIATVLAVLTAYIRVLGASMGTPHFFLGPMAKQHRMFFLNLGLIGSAVEVCRTGTFHESLIVVLYIVAVGTFVTCMRRTTTIFHHLAKK